MQAACTRPMRFSEEIDVAVRLVGALREPIVRLSGKDARLADYLRRSAHALAVALNEARWHQDAQRSTLVEQANESVSDVYAALELAEARGLLTRDQTAMSRRLLDREHDLLFEIIGVCGEVTGVQHAAIVANADPEDSQH